MGGHLWNWRNGNRRFMVPPWRMITGAEPDAIKVASPVLNGEDEETGRKALRLVLTQRRCLLRPSGLTSDGLLGVVLHLTGHLQRAAHNGGDYFQS
jgi:hypothetical protein